MAPSKKIAAALAFLAAFPILLASAPAHSQSLAGVDDICTLRNVDRMTATTRDCLTCHDGSIAPSHIPLPGAGPLEGSHPVDILYADSLARHPGTLNVRYDMPRRLVLPDGKVTCTTCHDGASTEPFRVAIPMSKSRLCFGCHNL